MAYAIVADYSTFCNYVDKVGHVTSKAVKRALRDNSCSISDNIMIKMHAGIFCCCFIDVWSVWLRAFSRLYLFTHFTADIIAYFLFKYMHLSLTLAMFSSHRFKCKVTTLNWVHWPFQCFDNVIGMHMTSFHSWVQCRDLNKARKHHHNLGKYGCSGGAAWLIKSNK